MKTTPLQQVKGRFGDKSKLVAAVQALATDELWLTGRLNEDKGLAKVSNTKLLKLHVALSRTKEQFGTRAKLVAAILVAENRVKDVGFQARLEGHPTPRLLDHHDAAVSRAAKPAKAKPTTPAKRKTRSKKSKLKAAA